MTAKFMYKAAHDIRPYDESILQKLALATYKSKKPSELEALWEAHDLIRDELEPENTESGTASKRPAIQRDLEPD